MNNNCLKDVIKYYSSRRSIRKFENRDLDSNLLNTILESAMKAPTCGNMQLYSVIVTRDEKRKAELSEKHFNQPACSAPVLLTVCADFNRFTRWCQLRNADAAYNNFLSFTSAFADAIIYAQQITTIAELYGLGTCYLGTVIYNAPEISSLLKLPELVMPVACLAIGWPAEEGVPTERLSLRAVVHEEEYRNDSDDVILSLFKEKEDYAPNVHYVEENGKDNLAQVFAEIRYPRSLNETFSAKLIEWLRPTFLR
ncbi:MAG: nitroreductase family protein [Muribaculaceae bacterium]|nr:nitroreductase family protein [Muribaculaceae bacterium]